MEGYVYWNPKGKNWESSTFIKTTYDISLDSQISLLPLGFSLLLGIIVTGIHPSLSLFANDSQTMVKR